MKRDWHPAKLLMWRRKFMDPHDFEELKKSTSLETANYIKRAEPTRWIMIKYNRNGKFEKAVAEATKE